MMNVDILLERLERVKASGPNQWMARCPAHDDRTPSLSIAYEGGKVLIHCFAGCSSEDVLEAVGLTWRDLYEDTGPHYWAPPVPERPKAPEVDHVERWRWVWQKAKPGHPLLKRYLQARGLSLEPPPTLRLLEGARPVMVAKVTSPGGYTCGLHFTTLKPDGSGRLEKRLARGSRPAGGAIRLYPLEDGKPLALTEGIETGLAVHQLTGWPVWAAVSATGLEQVQLPPEVQDVVVAVDADRAGLEAGKRLASRLLAEGRRVRVAVPPKAGADWLDLLAEVGR